MAGEEYDFTLIMIGDAGVGKTSLLLRFADDQFVENYMPTVGVDFRYRKFTLNGNRVKLQIWDTAGQERFRTMTASYYRGADGVILVYDISNEKSFQHVKDWMKSVDKYAREGVIRMVLGNKSDMEEKRRVPKNKAEAYADNSDVMWLETSAKSADNVTLAYRRMAKRLIEIKRFQKSGRGASRESKSKRVDVSPNEHRKKR
eukprot:CAMPEP_0197516286 /NCGR_PEP_ID=MMETSP1318-20131121/1151_1 /TAXON_ID=552666 /ORGANISM="Partenskyella glossopodia, Strain RCC365" /LENGTH=201 /DNA_ID=CAMNT_0043064897 /DNA_START=179 /DNA_END=781 /DNA_ORIENTATION=-